MQLTTFLKDNFSENEMLQHMCITDNAIKIKYNTVGNLAPKSNIDTYMSMNPIGYHKGFIKRDSEHVKRLKWLYIDLDTYNTLYSKNQVLMNLEADYFNRSIPTPTYVVDSGRGLYLLWRIDENVKATPRWLKVQKYLYEVLKEFGADRSVVTDRARVLRQIGSINSKSNTEVKVIRSTERNYTLYEIMQEFMPATEDTRYKTKIYNISTESTMLVSRLRDLETLLLEHRDANHSKRENIFFLYRYWNLCLTGDKKDSLDSIISLNNKMKNPLTERELVKATKSAERYYDKGCSFRMRNATLIDFLDITEEEQKDLYTIISSNVKKQRKQERNRKAYLRQLSEQGKVTKDRQIQHRKNEIKKLLEAGKGQAYICEKLNISKSTFYADKKDIELACSTQKNEDNSTEKMTDSACPENSALVLKDFSPYALAPTTERIKDYILQGDWISLELPHWSSG